VVPRVAPGQKAYCLRLLFATRRGLTRCKVGLGKPTPGVRPSAKAAIRYLRAQGYDPKDIAVDCGNERMRFDYDKSDISDIYGKSRELPMETIDLWLNVIRN